MQVVHTPSASRELSDAALFYQRIHPGLGERLLCEARDHVSLILANPEAPRLRERGYRRVNLKVFPYYIAYSIEGDVIVVLAFAHAARMPEYWIHRQAGV